MGRDCPGAQSPPGHPSGPGCRVPAGRSSLQNPRPPAGRARVDTFALPTGRGCDRPRVRPAPASLLPVRNGPLPGGPLSVTEAVPSPRVALYARVSTLGAVDRAPGPGSQGLRGSAWVGDLPRVHLHRRRDLRGPRRPPRPRLGSASPSASGESMSSWRRSSTDSDDPCAESSTSTRSADSAGESGLSCSSRDSTPRPRSGSCSGDATRLGRLLREGAHRRTHPCGAPTGPRPRASTSAGPERSSPGRRYAESSSSATPRVSRGGRSRSTSGSPPPTVRRLYKAVSESGGGGEGGSGAVSKVPPLSLSENPPPVEPQPEGGGPTPARKRPYPAHPEGGAPA